MGQRPTPQTRSDPSTPLPHHFHTPDGKITQSKMKGNPTKDITSILKETKKILKLQHTRAFSK